MLQVPIYSVCTWINQTAKVSHSFMSLLTVVSFFCVAHSLQISPFPVQSQVSWLSYFVILTCFGENDFGTQFPSPALTVNHVRTVSGSTRFFLSVVDKPLVLWLYKLCSLNGQHCKWSSSFLKWTSRVGPCRFFISWAPAFSWISTRRTPRQNGHLELVPAFLYPF